MEQKISALVTIGLVLIVILGGATVYHNLEKWSWVDSFYLSKNDLVLKHGACF